MEKVIRRAQTIQPFGVGSIVDITGEGFVVKDISRWDSKPNKKLKLERLQKLIGYKNLLSFSDSQSDKETLPVARFPRWNHCPRCGQLHNVRVVEDKRNEGATPVCGNPSCHSQVLSPMRFIAYCDNGHLSEINWHRWCHMSSAEAETGHCADYSKLYFKTTGRSGGDFDQMIIECKACEPPLRNTLSDIVRGRAPRSVVYARGQNCCGSQPWYTSSDEPEVCDQSMKIEPRGSSSIYRGRILSALDIDLETDVVNETPEFDTTELDIFIQDIQIDFPGTTDLAIAEVEDIQDGDYATKITIKAERAGISRSEAVQYICKGLSNQGESLISEASDEPVEDPQQKLLQDELAIFRLRQDCDTENLTLRFLDTKVSDNKLLHKLFSSIAQVKRLREIRVLTSFTRGKGLKEVSVDIKGNQDWFPAVEGFGEGIFFEINADTLNGYLAKNSNDLDNLVAPQRAALSKLKESYPVDIPESPLFIMAHTLSHLLIRQLTFNSGYSSSALRERLFVDPESQYAGILIYTSDSDVEGTMGGLVDQARLGSLAKVVEQCIEAAVWCSADPVCRETENQGFAGLNRSACHCCSLISETSCMFQNAMLNRLTLGGLGSDRNEVQGFFNYLRS